MAQDPFQSTPENKIAATYGAYEQAVNNGDPRAERMFMPGADYDGPIEATYDEYVRAVNEGDPSAARMKSPSAPDATGSAAKVAEGRIAATHGAYEQAVNSGDPRADRMFMPGADYDGPIEASYDDYVKAVNEGDPAAARMKSPPAHDALKHTDLAGDAAKHADTIGDVAKRINGGVITDIVAGAGAGMIAFAMGNDLATSGKISFQTAVPFGEAASALAEGDTHGAVHATMTETAGMTGAITGAMAGAAAGSVVPIVGTAIGAVAGGIIGGVAAGVGTNILLTEVPEIVDGVHDGINATMDYAGNIGDTIGNAYTASVDAVSEVGSDIYAGLANGWSSLTGYFNDNSGAEAVAAPTIQLDSVASHDIRDDLGTVDPGFAKDPGPVSPDPGFTAEIGEEQIEEQIEAQKVLENGGVLMGALAAQSIELDGALDSNVSESEAVDPGFAKDPGPVSPDPGFTPEIGEEQIEEQIEGQRTLGNGMVLMGAAPPQVEWGQTEKWPEVDCRQVISPHFNGTCKYDPALDNSNLKNPDLTAEAESAPSGSNWINPDTKGPGVFGMGGGA